MTQPDTQAKLDFCVVGSYVLHTYCKNSLGFYCGHGEFGGNNKREAYTEAKAQGWKIKGDDAWCPSCVRQKLTFRKAP